MYNEKILSLFKEMKNVGRIKSPNAIGKAKSGIGEVVEMYLLVNDSGIIEKASFKAFGPPLAIAVSSVLVDLIKGKRLNETANIQPDDITDILGKIDESRESTIIVSLTALNNAVKNYFLKQQKKSR